MQTKGVYSVRAVRAGVILVEMAISERESSCNLEYSQTYYGNANLFR